MSYFLFMGTAGSKNKNFCPLAGAVRKMPEGSKPEDDEKARADMQEKADAPIGSRWDPAER